MKISVKNHPHLWGQSIFHRCFDFFEKSIYLMVVKVWDRFWNLPDGHLDPLDRYKIPKRIEHIDFLDSFFIIYPWRAIINHLDLEIDAGKLAD